ncbi:MAG: elongation factor P [Bdellovibrionaceae bacterium]|jgi:elongation factor P|nr:elongation factor P [Pseudobdellovibrionaceae bacterium]
MIGTSDFKKGAKLLIDDQPYVITDFQHVKPGKGNQFTRTKMKNLISGTNLERTIKSGEKFAVPDVEYVDMNFLYKDDSGFHFMNQSNYEQLDLSAEVVGEPALFLTENLEVKICLFNERAILIEVPNTVVLEVTETDPGHKGNTVTGATKPAILETGAKVYVPLHISIGDRLKVDTRTCEYLERTKG